MCKKNVLLCAAIVFMAVFGIIIFLHHKKDTPDACKTPFTTYAQANIASSGNFLYYCDVQKNHALCSYNLKTKETQLLLEKMSDLRQTVSAIYCIANQELYQITDTSVQKLYDIPDSDFDFIDVVNESVFWISRGSQKSGDDASATVYRLYQKNLTNSAPPEILWEQNKTGIRDAVYYQERIYTLTYDGVYCTLPDSKTTKKISGLISQQFICSNDFLLFEYSSGDSLHGYYEITEDLQTLQKSAVVGSVASIYDGTLYYPLSETLWSVDLSSETRNRKNEGQLPGYPWSSIQATASGIFLRCYLTADIWFYDFETGESVCIIPQQQTE